MSWITLGIGIAIGLLAAWVGLRLTKEEEKTPSTEEWTKPRIHVEEFPILDVFAEVEIPQEVLLRTPQRAVEELKYEIGNTVWKKVDVVRVEDPRIFTMKYKGRLTIVDKGDRNPFLKQWRET